MPETKCPDMILRASAYDCHNNGLMEKFAFLNGGLLSDIARHKESLGRDRYFSFLVLFLNPRPIAHIYHLIFPLNGVEERYTRLFPGHNCLP